MASVNQVTLLGNLGKDPEVRAMQSGDRVASFSIATSEQWKDKESGEKREHTDWHNIVVWSQGLVEVCEKYLRKGSRVYVQGALKTRKWQDQSGTDRYTTEVVLRGWDAKLVMCGSPGQGARASEPQSEMDYGRSTTNSSGSMRPAPTTKNEFDDEIPF
jgi:single-strand DNA-binding protein